MDYLDYMHRGDCVYHLDAHTDGVCDYAGPIIVLIGDQVIIDDPEED